MEKDDRLNKLAGVFGDSFDLEKEEVKRTDRVNEILANKEEPKEIKEEPVVEVVEETPEEEAIIEPEIEVEEYVEEEVKEDLSIENTIEDESSFDDGNDNSTVLRDDEGFLEEISEFTVYNDEDTEGEIPVIKGINTINLPKYIKDKSLLFSKSDLDLYKSKTNMSATQMLKSFKKMGESIDIFLPVSNIAVRVYEFDNKSFLDDTLEILRSNYSEIVMNNGNKFISASRKLLDQVKDNCTFLCKDGDVISADFAIESLSKHDIDTLLLGVATLLIYSDNKANKNEKDKVNTYKYDFIYRCPKCSTENTVTVDLLELFKQQYSKMKDEEVQKAIDEYDVNESYMEKIAKSLHNKKVSVKYTRVSKVNKMKLTSRVIIQDPSYGAYKRQEEDVFRFILSKHNTVLNPHIYEIPSFNTYSNSRKVGLLINRLTSGEVEIPNKEDYVGFLKDYTLCNLIPFIGKIELESIGEGIEPIKKSILFDEETPSKKLESLSDLPTSFIEKIMEHIDTLIDKGTKPIEFKVTCGKCGDTTEQLVQPMDFFYTLIETTLDNNY